jgi:hypothetical protein
VSDDLTAVNPVTGEVLEHLDQQPPAALAEAFADIRARIAEHERWQRAIEGELRRRLKVLDRTLAVFGEWEVSAKPANESVWDVEELEAQMRALEESGVLKAGEWTEVIDRTPTVRAGEATRLINRLDGAPKKALEATRTWRAKRAKLTVARSVALPAPEDVGRVPPRADTADDGHYPAAPASGPARPTPSTLDPEELFA